MAELYQVLRYKSELRQLEGATLGLHWADTGCGISGLPIKKAREWLRGSPQVRLVESRGRYLLIKFSDLSGLVVNLKYSATTGVATTRELLPLETNLRFDTVDQRQWWFVLPAEGRRSTVQWYAQWAELLEVGPQSSCGVDVLSPLFTPELLQQRCRKRQTTAGNILIDERCFPGFGNELRCEVLWKVGIAPLAGSARIVERAQEVHRAAQSEVLQRLARCSAGGAAVGERVENMVWLRGGLPCKACGTLISKGEVRGWAVYWCPQCQI